MVVRIKLNVSALNAKRYINQHSNTYCCDINEVVGIGRMGSYFSCDKNHDGLGLLRACMSLNLSVCVINALVSLPHHCIYV